MAVSLALFIERYVLSFVFVWLGWRELKQALAIIDQHLSNQAVFLGAGRHLVLFAIFFFTTLLLLFGRRPTAPPRRLKYVVVPLLTTFFNFFYSLGGKFPLAWQTQLAPVSWQVPIMVASMVCILVGPFIALWGIASLGRSFGVFVAVRKVVLSGPYRWIRHPMYLGHVFSYAGVALAYFSVAYFVIVGIHLCLVVYRAHLEESELAQFSPEYREHMKRTGFLFPRFTNRVRTAGPPQF